MNKRIVMAVLLAVPITARAAKTDPRSVVMQLDAAMNAGKVDAASALFADDAVVTGMGPDVKGREAVKQWLASMKGFHVDSNQHKVTKDTVQWNFKVSDDDLKKQGVNPAEGICEATVAGGKIKSFHPMFSELTQMKMQKGAEEANKAAYRKIIDAFNSRDWNALDGLIAADAMDHNMPADAQAKGLAAVKQMFQMYNTAFPDYRFTAEDVFAAGDKVAARVTVKGTHKGDYMGIPATGKEATYSIFDIVRFNNKGMAVERWGGEDELGMLKQLGAVQVGVPKPAEQPMQAAKDQKPESKKQAKN